MDSVAGKSLSLHGLPSPAAELLRAGRDMALERKKFSLVEGGDSLTLSGGGRQHYGPYSRFTLSPGQSIQRKSDVIPGRLKRYGKTGGLLLAVGLGGAALAAVAILAVLLWFGARMLTGWGWGGYGLGGFGGPWGYW